MLRVDEERLKIASSYLLKKLSFMDYLEKWNLLEKSVHISDGISICCPFHADWDPSFKINTSKNIYKCFACGEKGGGNILTFIARYNKELLGIDTNYFKVVDSLIKSNPTYLSDLGFNTIFVKQELSVSEMNRTLGKRINLKVKPRVDLSVLFRKLKERGDKEQILNAISMVQEGLPIELIYNRLFATEKSVSKASYFDNDFMKELLGEEGDS